MHRWLESTTPLGQVPLRIAANLRPTHRSRDRAAGHGITQHWSTNKEIHSMRAGKTMYIYNSYRPFHWPCGVACVSDLTMYSKGAVCTSGPRGHTKWPSTAHCSLCGHCCLHDGSANWSLLRVSTSAGARVLTALTVYTAMVMRWPSQGHCHWCGLKVMPDMVRLCLRP